MSTFSPCRSAKLPGTTLNVDEQLLSGDKLLGDMVAGAPPVVLRMTSEQDEVTRVVNEIKGYLSNGAQLSHILVMHADWSGVERLLERLRQEFGPSAAMDAKDHPRGVFIRVCTLNAVTGLESPIVFVMGVHALYEEEQSLRLSVDHVINGVFFTDSELELITRRSQVGILALQL